ERIILGAQQNGVDRVYMMPDPYNMGYRVEDKLKTSGELQCQIEVFDFYKEDTVEDTYKAVQLMNQKNAGCIVTLGGDGTNRAVAKDIGEIPMISISTGTNNVYPDMIEGTIAGIAAAVVASHKFDKNVYSNRDKIIEIYTDGQLRDIALIDAVISRDIFVGSRAIWRVEDIEKIFVARSHPASIGFSAVVGGKTIITEADDYGAYVSIDKDAPKIKIPMSAGIVLAIGTSEPVILNFNEKYTFTTYCRGTIALDGEREIEFHQNQDFTFKISRNGPWHVDVKKAIEVGQKNGFFKVL
ncbi:MAG: NAD(+)/NADH kinase, partial [Acetobacterium sp.]|nr:NAD(+)/NADH kinase [Acetobacterium sp.]